MFQSPFQSAPLDLDTDAFFPARASTIEARLQEVALGKAADLPGAAYKDSDTVPVSDKLWETEAKPI